MRLKALVVVLVLLAAVAGFAQELKVASLGDFKLTSGEVLRDCKVGYRTFGKLNPARTNAILFPTWFGGTSQDLERHIGPGRLVDPARWFVIAADALGNGVSSSPSNSPTRPRMAFPRLSIRDMVASQYALLTRELGLARVHAVVGLSMGGMQAFQWLVSYPDFMDVAIPIIGSPKLASYDLFFWRTYCLAITRDADWNQGNYVENPAREIRRGFWSLLGSTPEKVSREVSREQVGETFDKARAAAAADANDQIRQAEAMLGLDISEAFGGSMAKASAAVKARVLVVVGRTDHTVTPGPALDFARLLNAEALVLENDCGHGAPGCESDRVRQAVTKALGSR
jgi:homoserine O-acetyltransferase